MPIYDRVNYILGCTVTKALHNQMHEYITNMFDSKTRATTRNLREQSLKILNCKLDVSCRGLAYKSYVLYNDLNANITNGPTWLNRFTPLK